MQDNKKQETLMYAAYFVSNQTTVRGVAKRFGVSKTTVHNRLAGMTEDMFVYEKDKRIVREVKKLLEKNKRERHIKGGNAMKQKNIFRRQLNANNEH